jgi:hypothetical protein
MVQSSDKEGTCSYMCIRQTRCSIFRSAKPRTAGRQASLSSSLPSGLLTRSSLSLCEVVVVTPDLDTAYFGVGARESREL